MEQIGYGYARLERDGIISPVIALDCQYKHPTTFDDEVSIHIQVEEFRGVRLVIGYTMTNVKTADVVLTGTSTHCFTDRTGMPIMLRRQFPDFDLALRALAAKEG